MITRFPSQGRNGVAYCLLGYADRLDTFRVRAGYLSDQIGEYMCYDDGIVQHSPTSFVYGENVVDCLVSLAIFIHENKNTELLKELESFWPTDLSAENIDFAASLTFCSNKTRYYNLSTRKVSASEKYRWDKRWAVVPEWANGSLESVCMLLLPDYWNGLQRFYFYNNIRRHMGAGRGYIDGCMCGIPGQAFDAPTQNATSAFSIIDAVVRAYRLCQTADRSMESLRYNLTVSQQQVA